MTKRLPGSRKSSGGSTSAVNDLQKRIQEIIGNQDLNRVEKQKRILSLTSKPRKKYASAAERKQAQKDYRQRRREDERERLSKLDPALAPKKRVKLTEEEKADHQREYRRSRYYRNREFLREQIAENPAKARQFGFDPSKYFPKIPGMPIVEDIDESEAKMWGKY